MALHLLTLSFPGFLGGCVFYPRYQPCQAERESAGVAIKQAFREEDGKHWLLPD